MDRHTHVAFEPQVEALEALPDRAPPLRGRDEAAAATGTEGAKGLSRGLSYSGEEKRGFMGSYRAENKAGSETAQCGETPDSLQEFAPEGMARAAGLEPATFGLENILSAHRGHRCQSFKRQMPREELAGSDVRPALSLAGAFFWLSAPEARHGIAAPCTKTAVASPMMTRANFDLPSQNYSFRKASPPRMRPA